MKISPARRAAFDVLLRIERDGAFSSVLLPQFEEGLSEKDRGLCHEIVLGVLRRKLYLDALIRLLSNGRKLDFEVRIALQIALFQLIFLDRVPAHSAINESVELVVRAKKTSAKAFVNALLRSFQRDRPILTFTDVVERISTETSHPRWLVERWTSQFGIESTEAICRANNATPLNSFRLVSSEVDDLANEFASSNFVRGCFVSQRITPKLRKLANESKIYFQDEGSQLVAQVVIDAGGKSVLDVCAAPGGKTTMIANSSNAKVIAGDIHLARVERLKETCATHLTDVKVVQIDAETGLPFEKRSFETVFVDAPCSGTGTIRHNPEIRYSVLEQDIQELASKQLRILRNASELVVDGGTLIYSTCSIERDENEGVCERFLETNDEFSVERLNLEQQFLTDRGFARTFPHRDEMDGFFIARFRRVDDKNVKISL